MFSGFEIAAGVFGGVGGVQVVGQGGRAAWRRTFGRRLHAARRVQALSVGYTVERFEAILSSPTSRKFLGSEQQLIWVDPLYYVQARVDDAEQIVWWSVTARSLKFRPVLFPSTRRPFKVRLNRTKFCEIDHEPSEIFGSRGARRGWYWERLYYGNPGNYQEFFFAINDAAPNTNQAALIEVVRAMEDHEQSDATAIALAEPSRASLVPNTYAETLPSFGTEVGPLDVGVDLDHVRLFP